RGEEQRGGDRAGHHGTRGVFRGRCGQGKHRVQTATRRALLSPTWGEVVRGAPTSAHARGVSPAGQSVMSCTKQMSWISSQEPTIVSSLKHSKYESSASSFMTTRSAWHCSSGNGSAAPQAVAASLHNVSAGSLRHALP